LKLDTRADGYIAGIGAVNVALAQSIVPLLEAQV